MSRLNASCLTGILATFVLLIAGCGGADSKGMFAEAADTNAKRIGMLYFQFQTQNVHSRLLGPSNLDDFKVFIGRQNEAGLALVGVDKDNLDELFVSPRDQQPYKIRWKVQGVDRGPAQPVVFEEEGADGKWVVGFTGFIEKEVDRAEYDRLWSGAADQEHMD